MLIFYVTLLLDNMLLLYMSENNMTFPCYLYSYLFSLQYYSLFSQELHLYFFVSRMKTKTVMWYFMEVVLQAGDLYLYGISLFVLTSSEKHHLHRPLHRGITTSFYSFLLSNPLSLLYK